MYELFTNKVQYVEVNATKMHVNGTANIKLCLAKTLAQYHLLMLQ